ncbi:hypothetical protein T459_05170 [Capsicum annuum]|uniref:F-box domain-containing protein n=1 Tax=Capsicum annuum TaxID=4072 RepID=A0A2G3A749_CAPAN|nr:hypothetical protein T459_05170 [Capsicum annuum]
MAPKGKGNGKKKGKSNGNSKETKFKATSDLYFPKEIIFDILSRLPVKTLLRFRCVCKQWRKLISKPNFIAAHFRCSSSLQRSGSSLIIGSLHQESNNHVLSLYNPPDSLVELDNPFPCFFPNMYIWGLHSLASVGMAFDYQQNDLLVLRIFCVRLLSPVPNHIEMYFTKSGRWKKLKNEMIFYIGEFICNAIVKGVPYWLVCMPDKFGVRAVFMRFDVRKEEFEKLPSIGRRRQHQFLVDLEDSLCMLDWDHKDNCHIDVWVLDDVDGWSMQYSVGTPFRFDQILGCLRNGDVIAENDKGVVFLCDSITSSVKEKFSLDTKEGSYVVVDYSESLFLFGGMLPVKKQDVQDKVARKKLTRFL